MTLPRPITHEHLQWLKEERVRLRHQFDVLSSGACRMGYNAGNGWIDTTSEMLGQLSQRMADLDRLIGDKTPAPLRSS